MSVVPRSNKFACKLAAQKCARMYIFGRGCPWFHSEATFCAMHKSRRQNAHGWAGNKSVASFGTKLVLCRCNKEVHRQRSTRMYNCLTVYFKRLTESMFSKAVAVCASTSCCTKRIGTGFIYHSCSTFQFLIVRVASSNPAPMSTIFFPSALCCAA